MKRHLCILSVLSISFTAIGNPSNSVKQFGLIKVPSLQQVQKCQQRPSFMNQVQALSPIHLQAIQNQVLVGKKAEFYIEAQNADGSFSHAYTSQIFKDKNSKVICGQSQDFQKTFSFYAPTLIDTNADKKVGDSFWQFQINAQINKFASWNRKTQALKGAQSLEKTLASVGGEYKIFKISEKEIQIIFSKEQDGVQQFLSIQYDLLTN